MAEFVIVSNYGNLSTLDFYDKDDEAQEAYSHPGAKIAFMFDRRLSRYIKLMSKASLA